MTLGADEPAADLEGRDSQETSANARRGRAAEMLRALPEARADGKALPSPTRLCSA